MTGTMPPRATAPRRRPPWWLVLLAAVVVAVSAVAVLGGFNDVPIEKLPTVKLGTTQVGNEITTTVTRSYLSSTAPVTGYDLDPGKVDLVVEGTVTNTTDKASVFTPDIARVLLDGVIDPAKAPNETIELRSGKALEFLQPGLPTKVAWTWEIDATDVAAGDRLIIGVFARHPVADNPLFADAQSAAEPVVRIVTTIEGK